MVKNEDDTEEERLEKLNIKKNFLLNKYRMNNNLEKEPKIYFTNDKEMLTEFKELTKLENKFEAINDKIQALAESLVLLEEEVNIKTDEFIEKYKVDIKTDNGYDSVKYKKNV